MFDVGFSEVILVLVVSLIVIGPEQLPHILRKFMLWRGRVSSQYNLFKRNLEQELGADEIRQQLHNEEILKQHKKGEELVQEVHEEMQALHSHTEIQHEEHTEHDKTTPQE